MTLTHVISVGGDILYSGPAERSAEFMRTHAFADRVTRASDGVLLATKQSFDRVGLLEMAFDQPGSPDRALGVAWVRGVA